MLGIHHEAGLTQALRIGQTEPVQVVLMAYRNTLQTDALKLVAQKLQSSLAVEAEVPEDGLAAYGDDGEDLMLALVRTRFAGSHSWTEEGENRLRLVGDEAILSLLEEENDGPAGQKRRLIATIRADGGSAELEIVVASDDAIQGNIEDRMAYLGQDQALEDEQDLSVRILRHYASSVHHRKYYGIDIVSCRVDQ